MVAVVLFDLSAAAQNGCPTVEIFGGYQFTHLEPTLDANGWGAAVNGNFNRWLGVTADFSGTYKNSAHIYTYMFGPSFTARTGRVSAFGHTLLGGATSRAPAHFPWHSAVVSTSALATTSLFA